MLFVIFKETKEQQARWEMCKIKTGKRIKRKRKGDEDFKKAGKNKEEKKIENQRREETNIPQDGHDVSGEMRKRRRKDYERVRKREKKTYKLNESEKHKMGKSVVVFYSL